MRRSRLQRVGLLLTALFQLLLPAFVSVADARAEDTSARGAVAHVESHSTSRCIPVHANDCVLCRVLSAGAATSRAAAAPAPVARLINATVPEYASALLGSVAQGHPSSRAPPVE